MVVFLIYFAILPPIEGPKEWDELASGIDVYIFCFVIVFILFSVGAAIQIFRAYHVNYAFIFEIDQNNKLIHHQMYKVTLIFFFVWGFCFIWQIAKVKLDFGIWPEYATFTLICLLLFIFMCFQPFHLLFRRDRLSLAKTLGHIIISPFGLVRFRHFFLADVLTSIITPLQFNMIFYCYFFGKN